MGEFKDRGAGKQGGYQAAGTCVAIAFGLVGGAIVGMVLTWHSVWLKLNPKCTQN